MPTPPGVLPQRKTTRRQFGALIYMEVLSQGLADQRGDRGSVPNRLLIWNGPPPLRSEAASGHLDEVGYVACDQSFHSAPPPVLRSSFFGGRFTNPLRDMNGDTNKNTFVCDSTVSVLRKLNLPPTLLGFQSQLVPQGRSELPALLRIQNVLGCFHGFTIYRIHRASPTDADQYTESEFGAKGANSLRVGICVL